MILGSIALGNWDSMFNTGTYSVLFIIIIITIMILSNPAMRMAFLHSKFSLFGIKTSPFQVQNIYKIRHGHF